MKARRFEVWSRDTHDHVLPFTMSVFPDQETSDISRTRRKNCFTVRKRPQELMFQTLCEARTSVCSMTIGGRRFSDVLDGHGLKVYRDFGTGDL